MLCMCIYVLCMHMYVLCMCVHIYRPTHTFAHMHTHVHMLTHTYIKYLEFCLRIVYFILNIWTFVDNFI